MSARSAAVFAAVLAGALALAGCAPTGTSPTHHPSDTPSDHASASSTPTKTATPTPTPAAAVFTLPAGCTAIASAATLTALFANIPSRPANGLTRPAPASAAKTLECSWFTGDTTGGDVIYYTAPAADDQAYLTTMQANGYTCAAALDGTRCDKSTPNSQYPVNTIETTFTRDNVWIYLSFTNVDVTSLLPDMVATAWKG